MASNNTLRWEPSKNIRFINEYKQHRCLWDPNHALYKNREAREAAYTQIKEALDMVSVVEVIGRIRVLRNTLSNELLKAKTPNRKGQMYKSRIKWLAHMDFIIDMLNGEKKKNEKLYKPHHRIELVHSKNTSKNQEKDEPIGAVAPQSNTDEFYLFGLTVAEQLRQLPLETALETEEMILAIIRKRRVEIANRPKETEPELNAGVVKIEEHWCESSFDTNSEEF